MSVARKIVGVQRVPRQGLLPFRHSGPGGKGQIQGRRCITPSHKPMQTGRLMAEPVRRDESVRAIDSHEELRTFDDLAPTGGL